MGRPEARYLRAGAYLYQAKHHLRKERLWEVLKRHGCFYISLGNVVVVVEFDWSFAHRTYQSFYPFLHRRWFFRDCHVDDYYEEMKITCAFCKKVKETRKRPWKAKNYCDQSCYLKATKKWKEWSSRKSRPNFATEQSLDSFEEHIKKIEDTNKWNQPFSDEDFEI